jgi:beta-N-acetylhexosaminidase
MNLIKDNYADSVMVGHIFNRRVDKNYPASLSSAHIKTELQKRLGYKGLIISDDMQMGAITKYYGLDEAVVRSIGSGTNIVILSNNISFYDEEVPSKAVEAVVKAVEKGTLTRESILASAAKIRKAKQKIITE